MYDVDGLLLIFHSININTKTYMVLHGHIALPLDIGYVGSNDITHCDNTINIKIDKL